MDGSALLGIAGVSLLIIALVVQFFVNAPTKEELAQLSTEPLQKYCPNCGTVAVPQLVRDGSGAAEVLLWLLCILPGIIYSSWRRSTDRWSCPACGQSAMIPLESPKARAAIGAQG